MQMKITTAQIEGLDEFLAGIQFTAQMRGLIYGLVPSNNATTPNTHLDFSVGGCRSSDDTYDIIFTSAMTKRLDQPWSAGANGGLMDSGAKAASTGYHIYAIYNVTTGAEDYIASASATAPVLTLATGFTKFRRICSIMTDAAGNIRRFIATQTAQGLMMNFLPAGRILDINAQANGGVFLRQIFVPQGRKWWTRFYHLSTGTSGASLWAGIQDPQQGVPTTNVATDYGQISRNSMTRNSAEYWQWTDTNRQIYTTSNDGSDVCTVMVLGWLDDRNAFD